jgi:hypothetical protein
LCLGQGHVGLTEPVFIVTKPGEKISGEERS